MKNPSIFTWFALLIALGGAAAQAQAQTAQPKTREEVKRELAEAIRDGTIPYGDTGLTPREMFPQRYPKVPVTVGRTRAEVRAEFEAARRSGELSAGGESGLKLNELDPSQYPPRAAAAGLTREQVKAELAEAQRTGDLYAGGESGLKLKELYPGSYPKAPRPMYASAPASAASAGAR